MGVTTDHYAREPGLLYGAAEQTNAALRSVLSYRIYRDQERGWRITAPNLEQCGLLVVDYLSLPEVCADASIWKKRHEALEGAAPADLERICRTLLNFMRQELAIRVEALDPEPQERMKQRSDQRLLPPWGFDENETVEHSKVLYPRSRRAHDMPEAVFLSTRSGFGQYLRRSGTFSGLGRRPSLEETGVIISDLLEVLRKGGLVECVRDDEETPGYQLPAAALIWKAGDGTRPFHDPIRMPRLAEGGGRTNQFFVQLYGEAAQESIGLEAREHTAQVLTEVREEREKHFREGKLPVLYCSATMELGVDIARLNVVNMRNIPPTPANYAQRSGRAGRSGQPALVFSYCSTFRSHDQYFFRRPLAMVSGSVAPPRIELANEDLVRTHIHSLWLTTAQYAFGRSLNTFLDCEGEQPSLDLKPAVREDLFAPRHRGKVEAGASRLLASIGDELQRAPWYHAEWCKDILDRIPQAFDQACDRWRTLYRAALRQRAVQHAIEGDPTRPPEDRKRARILRAEAEQQRDLLIQAQNVMEADFYTYRYLASEGFLPGYNFPRLPLSAYVPARRQRSGKDEYISRPRFLAISEFGPRSLLYHEGARYRIEKVILPLRGDADVLATQSAKVCTHCGYLHEVGPVDTMNVCDMCGTALAFAERRLFRMENVSTRRIDRINSDEEERSRFGYNVRTAIRFAERSGQRTERRAEIRAADGSGLARLAYGPAATLWRINQGWARKGKDSEPGFLLDIERGYWASNPRDEEDRDSPLGQRTVRVLPYVEDHRNALLFEPLSVPAGDDAQFMPTLQAALKNSILAVFQLEEDELAAEPLPSLEDRRKILLYESAEGGAGVLRRLVEEPDAVRQVARKALELLHFDPRHRRVTCGMRPWHGKTVKLPAMAAS